MSRWLFTETQRKLADAAGQQSDTWRPSRNGLEQPQETVICSVKKKGPPDGSAIMFPTIPSHLVCLLSFMKFRSHSVKYL